MEKNNDISLTNPQNLSIFITVVGGECMKAGYINQSSPLPSHRDSAWVFKDPYNEDYDFTKVCGVVLKDKDGNILFGREPSVAECESYNGPNLLLPLYSKGK